MEIATGTDQWSWNPRAYTVLAELDAQAFAGIELPRMGNQTVSELRVNAPVARLVGVGQSRSSDRLANTYVIEFLRRADRQTAISRGLSR